MKLSVTPRQSVDAETSRWYREIAQAVNERALSADVPSTGAPAGAVIFSASSTLPAGYLKANGAAISRTTYSALFAAIGTAYGVGDGSTTFNLPDLRGEFLRGFDDGRGIDSSRVLGSAQSHAVAHHAHFLRNMLNGDYANYGTGGGLGGWGMQTTANNDGAARLKAGDESPAAANSGEFAAETRPRNVALLACIKY